MMMAASGAPGALNGAIPNGSATGATVAAWQLNNDGSYSITTGLSGNWVSPATAGLAALYQVKIDVTAGAFTAGPGAIPSDSTGSFIDLSTSRHWFRNAAGTVTFNATIREKATGLVRSIQSGVMLTYT